MQLRWVECHWLFRRRLPPGPLAVGRVGCLSRGDVMTLIDNTIVNTAVPVIRTGLGVSQSGVSWVCPATRSLLASRWCRPGGSATPTAVEQCSWSEWGCSPWRARRAGCRRPRRSWFSPASSRAPAGGITAQVSALIQTLFHGAERGRAFGLLGMLIGVSTVGSELLGGVILTVAGSADAWRWVFLANLPVGVVAFLLALRLVPASLGSGAIHSTSSASSSWPPACCSCCCRYCRAAPCRKRCGSRFQSGCSYSPGSWSGSGGTRRAAICRWLRWNCCATRRTRSVSASGCSTSLDSRRSSSR